MAVQLRLRRQADNGPMGAHTQHRHSEAKVDNVQSQVIHTVRGVGFVLHKRAA
jgi:hypothetical protein